MAKAKITKDDREFLKTQGWVEGNPATIPENISPVLKQQLMDEWKDKQDGEVDAIEMPTAVERQNQMVREREAGKDDDQSDDKTAKPDPLDHDNNGRKGGVRRQGDVNK